MNFTSSILKWYLINKRDLPWRTTKDPYFIWLSEIILQQTRVEQGLFYYYKFAEEFPSVYDLASAEEERVLKLWQGLGYYSRARNLHTTAKKIVSDHNGSFPASSENLKKLKGIGDYTAAAIASFAYNERVPVVDGNVARVVSRYFGMQEEINSGAGKKQLADISEKLISDADPATYNQAIMEFGALHCKPNNPLCSECPVSATCYALNNKMIAELPNKKKAGKSKHRYFNYFIVQDGEQVLMNQREEKDIWQSLFEFPLLEESETEYLTQHPEKLIEKKFKDPKSLKLISVSKEYKHILSHQVIHAKFYQLKSTKKLHNHFTNYAKYNLKHITNLPISRLTDRYLQDINFYTKDVNID